MTPILGWCRSNVRQVALYVDVTCADKGILIMRKKEVSVREPCLKVGIDVGTKAHQVGILTPDGEIDEFEITHDHEGFHEFFSRIESHREENDLPVKVAAEGCNGHIRPLDQKVINKGYELFNVNNLKLARFKEIFPGAAKTDEIDARKIIELFSLQERLPMAKEVITRVHEIPEENQKLKALTRRRKQLVEDRIRVQNRMMADLNAVCPGLLKITNSADNYWFLNFLTCRDDLRKLARLSEKAVLGIRSVGKKYAQKIGDWQKEAEFSSNAEYMGEIIVEDAKRVLELKRQIEKLDKAIEPLVEKSDLARTIISIPGFGVTGSAELAGEIGSMDRFESENSLALYLGMCPLDRSSGQHKGAKAPKHVNKRAKSAMMTAVFKHAGCVPESKAYYERKRAEGKKHNQAIRSLGRNLVRVIWALVRDGRMYEQR